MHFILGNLETILGRLSISMPLYFQTFSIKANIIVIDLPVNGRRSAKTFFFCRSHLHQRMWAIALNDFILFSPSNWFASWWLKAKYYITPANRTVSQKSLYFAHVSSSASIRNSWAFRLLQIFFLPRISIPVPCSPMHGIWDKLHYFLYLFNLI